MAKSEMIRARVEPDLKEEAESILTELGLSPTEAVTLFYRQVAMRKGLPFEVRIPNAKTKKALRDARARKGLGKRMSLEALKARYG
ncbi:MAG TPA: type II toxin-antitoxin system RelB/DinJ family antitoxin [Rhizomicrobium sp.]